MQHETAMSLLIASYVAAGFLKLLYTIFTIKIKQREKQKLTGNRNLIDRFLYPSPTSRHIL